MVHWWPHNSLTETGNGMGGQKLKAAWAKAESQATCKEDVNICKKPYVTKEDGHYETVVGSYPRGKCFVAPDLGVRGRPQSSKKKKLPGGKTNMRIRHTSEGQSLNIHLIISAHSP